MEFFISEIVSLGYVPIFGGVMTLIGATLLRNIFRKQRSKPLEDIDDDDEDIDDEEDDEES